MKMLAPAELELEKNLLDPVKRNSYFIAVIVPAGRIELDYDSIRTLNRCK
jgi:hypothetical protein